MHCSCIQDGSTTASRSRIIRLGTPLPLCRAASKYVFTAHPADSGYFTESHDKEQQKEGRFEGGENQIVSQTLRDAYTQPQAPTMTYNDLQ